MSADHRELESEKGGRRRRRLHPLAIVSILLGLLSLRPIVAVAAVLTGLLARRSIRRSDGRTWGRTVALIGVALGVIGLGTSAISTYRILSLYREVTPVAERFLTMIGNEEWNQTYDLFSPTYQVKTLRDNHPPDQMRRRFGQVQDYGGLRWAYRLAVEERMVGNDLVRVTYDVRFHTGTRRYTFDFVQTESGWRIDKIRPG